MKHGGWVPISKGFLRLLPKGRPYSELEAAFSLQVDYDANAEVTVSGYADLWGWSRKRVSTFLRKLGVTIEYPMDTAQSRNQRGHIAIHNRSITGAKEGQIRFIDNKGLEVVENINGAKTDHDGSKSRPTTRKKEIENDIPYVQIVSFLNEKTGKSFRVTTEKTRHLIAARWRQGFRLDDFNHVITTKATQWRADPKMSAFLRPETLFGPKFEAYLNETSTPAKANPAAGSPPSPHYLTVEDIHRMNSVNGGRRP